MVGDLAGPVVLNITEGLIEGAERGALFRNNSMLRRFCGRRRIVHAVLSTSGEFPPLVVGLGSDLFS